MSVDPGYAQHVRDQLMTALERRDGEAAEEILRRMSLHYPAETLELVRALVDVGLDRMNQTRRDDNEDQAPDVEGPL